MPPLNKHDNQYTMNKSHLTNLLGLRPPPYDWVVTVSFYCAVHLIEKELARHNKHPSDHKQRFTEMEARMTLDSLADDYRTLYNESRTSRYKCTNISQTRAETVLKSLNKIETELA